MQLLKNYVEISLQTLTKEENGEIQRGDWNRGREEIWREGKGDSIYTKKLWQIDFFNVLFHNLLKEMHPDIDNKQYWHKKKRHISIN